MASISAIFSMN